MGGCCVTPGKFLQQKPADPLPVAFHSYSLPQAGDVVRLLPVETSSDEVDSMEQLLEFIRPLINHHFKEVRVCFVFRLICFMVKNTVVYKCSGKPPGLLRLSRCFALTRNSRQTHAACCVLGLISLTGWPGRVRRARRGAHAVAFPRLA